MKSPEMSKLQILQVQLKSLWMSLQTPPVFGSGSKYLQSRRRETYITVWPRRAPNFCAHIALWRSALRLSASAQALLCVCWAVLRTSETVQKQVNPWGCPSPCLSSPGQCEETLKRAFLKPSGPDQDHQWPSTDGDPAHLLRLVWERGCTPVLGWGRLLWGWLLWSCAILPFSSCGGLKRELAFRVIKRALFR